MICWDVSIIIILTEWPSSSSLSLSLCRVERERGWDRDIKQSMEWSLLLKCIQLDEKWCQKPILWCRQIQLAIASLLECRSGHTLGCGGGRSIRLTFYFNGFVWLSILIQCFNTFYLWLDSTLLTEYLRNKLKRVFWDKAYIMMWREWAGEMRAKRKGETMQYIIIYKMIEGERRRRILRLYTYST